MTLTIGPLATPEPSGESWNDDLLIEFLSEELSINQLVVNDTSLSLQCGPFFESTDSSRSARFVELYRECKYLYSGEASAVAARLLHDLKNTIIGYNAALAQDSVTATEALVYKLQASKHRDTALLLIASLETLWGVLANPVGVEIHPDVGAIGFEVASRQTAGGDSVGPQDRHVDRREPAAVGPARLAYRRRRAVGQELEAVPIVPDHRLHGAVGEVKVTLRWLTLQILFAEPCLEFLACEVEMIGGRQE